VLLDVVTPGLALAHAIGRWGNYFNQELFGRPSTLPWAVQIDVAHRPAAYVGVATFHPTFLYESLWNLAVVAIVLTVERRASLRSGYLFAVYVAAYTFGRFFTEWMRIDDTHRFLGLRLNDWTSIVVLTSALALLLWRGLTRQPSLDDTVDLVIDGS
jgi:prolipoprotein diacylglyceryl transferase